MKKSLLLVALVFALTAGLHARAQEDQPDGRLPPASPDGCAGSPENPTLLLAGLAGGAFAVSSMRTRFRARGVNKK
jgi:XrtJ-associated TM-motif-TM protein